MRVLLISTYELGHQPLHVASPAAALRRAGHEVRCLDLSVQPWDPDALDWARAVEGIGGLEITIARGRPVVPLPEGDRYLGFMFARGASPDAVERSLRVAHGLLRICIEPHAPEPVRPR